MDHARLAWGSVAPTPIRSIAAEAALVGSLLDPSAGERSLAALASDIAPIDDIRSDREYRTRGVRLVSPSDNEASQPSPQFMRNSSTREVST